MSEDERLMAAIRKVSALAGREVDVSILDGGFTNGVFLVRADDERYVLRVPGQSSHLFEINRADERYNAEMAATTGVSPEVLDYVDDMDVMVLEFIDGHVPTVKELQTAVQVRRIAEAVRLLHGAPRFNNDADMFARAKRWLSYCEQHSIRVPDGTKGRMGELDEIARALSVDPLPSVPCHNDLAPYNFIDDGEQLWIIDFEFSGNNDPCFDLGMIASEAELDDELGTILCESYFGKADISLLARMKLCTVLLNVGWSLYCAIQVDALSDQTFWEGATDYWTAVVDALDSPELPRLLSSVTTT